MPFQEDFSQFLDIDGGFATEALITPAIGQAYKVAGNLGKNEEWWAVEDSNFRPLRCQRNALTN